MHHVALLMGYGASAVNPYLLFESAEDMARRVHIGDIDEEGEDEEKPEQDARCYGETAVHGGHHRGLLALGGLRDGDERQRDERTGDARSTHQHRVEEHVVGFGSGVGDDRDYVDDDELEPVASSEADESVPQEDDTVTPEDEKTTAA